MSNWVPVDEIRELNQQAARLPQVDAPQAINELHFGAIRVGSSGEVRKEECLSGHMHRPAKPQSRCFLSHMIDSATPCRFLGLTA